MTKTAIILAAGLGSRIQEKLQGKPKGFLQIERKSLIERSIDNLFALGIEKIIIGTGYKKKIYEALAEKYHEKIICQENPKFAETGSMATLNCLKYLIQTDFLLLESDLLYEKRALQELLEIPEETAILASGFTHSEDEVFIETNQKNQLINLSKNQNELTKIDGELTGINKISQNTFQQMNIYFEANFQENPKLDYEIVLARIAQQNPIYVHQILDLVWCEIDCEEHYQRALKSILPKLNI